MRRSWRQSLVLLVLLSSALAACGGSDDDPTATTGAAQLPTNTAVPGEQATQPPDQPTQPAAPTQTTGEQPAATSTTAAPPADATATLPQTVELTAEQLQQYRPNELGWIPLLQYHHFNPVVTDPYVRTPDQFRADLQWLYDNNYYVVNIHDYIDDTMEVPLGKHPVMLSFDDGAESQFRFIPLDNGQLALDGESAIGILEQFFRDHPDFGRGGHFAILPGRTFAWPDHPEQYEYAEEKLAWLLANGYEIGNHTLDHANLAEIGPDEVMYQLAEGNIGILAEAQEAVVRIHTLPFGAYPNGGDDTVFKGFDYNGGYYEFEGVLLVGANPAFSVLSTQYDPYAIPRIQMFDEEFNQKWLPFLEENPDVIYTSDGNPNTVTVPETLHWALVDTLDESRVGDRQLVRY